MKVLARLFLFLAVVNSSPAQQPLPSTPQEPTDVAILKFSWARERLPGWENNPFGPSFETYDAMRARIDNERKLQLARNAANKAEVGRRETDAKTLSDARAPKEKPKSMERPRDGYRYKIVVHNGSAKTISAVDWDYVFYDPISQQEISRRQFTSEEKIGPGKSKELSVLILSPPIETINVKALEEKKEKPFHERVILVLITYSDGSTWQLP